ncbi:hypothetical protein, partial [Streptomyces sp. NPDC001500]
VTRLAPSDLGLLTADPDAVAGGVLDGGGLLIHPATGGLRVCEGEVRERGQPATWQSNACR